MEMRCSVWGEFGIALILGWLQAERDVATATTIRRKYFIRIAGTSGHLSFSGASEQCGDQGVAEPLFVAVRSPIALDDESAVDVEARQSPENVSSHGCGNSRSQASLVVQKLNQPGLTFV